MENLQPIQRKLQKGKTYRTEFLVKGYLGAPIAKETQKKEPKASNRIGMSTIQGQILSISVIGLALAVALMTIWINRLVSERQDKDLLIKNLSSKVSTLEKNVEENDISIASSPSALYRPIPSNISPVMASGIENPDMAKKETFEYERFFKNAEILISENKTLTYYICNDQAALRLIRDSQLPYTISSFANNEYALLLIGKYEPSWVVQLDNLQKIRRDFMSQLISVTANVGTSTAYSSTQIGTGTNYPSLPAIPEELQGLELRRVYTLYNIQISADTNLERLKTQVGILRNEGIPAFIYAYTDPGRSNMYSLRIGIFPTDVEAKGYSDKMSRVTYRELINKEIDGRFIRTLRLE